MSLCSSAPSRLTASWLICKADQTPISWSHDVICAKLLCYRKRRKEYYNKRLFDTTTVANSRISYSPDLSQAPREKTHNGDCGNSDRHKQNAPWYNANPLHSEYEKSQDVSHADKVRFYATRMPKFHCIKRFPRWYKTCNYMPGAAATPHLAPCPESLHGKGVTSARVVSQLALHWSILEPQRFL